MSKKVYIPMSADLFHIGHLRAIRQCAKKGEVIIGLLSDEVIKRYKGNYPIISLEERRELLEALPEVFEVRVQDSLYPNLFGMDYLASSDGFEREEREAMSDYNIKPLEFDYYKKQSTTKIKEKIWKLKR